MPRCKYRVLLVSQCHAYHGGFQGAVGAEASEVVSNDYATRKAAERRMRAIAHWARAGQRLTIVTVSA